MILKDCRRGTLYLDDEHYPMRVVHGNSEDTAVYLNSRGFQDARYKNVRVDFYDNMLGAVRTRCTIVIRKNPQFPARMKEMWMGECHIDEVKEIIQRQQDVRANVCIELPMYIENGTEFYATITNISAGGVYMVTHQELDAGDVICFRYNFNSAEREFPMRPVWGRRTEDGRYGYGLRFTRLSSGSESDVRAYVFRVLREERQFMEEESLLLREDAE